MIVFMALWQEEEGTELAHFLQFCHALSRHEAGGRPSVDAGITSLFPASNTVRQRHFL